MQFGVSTHLFHAQRLRRDHLAEVAAHGFDAVEIVRDAVALRLSRPRRPRRGRRLADARRGLRAAQRARADHASASTAGGRPLLDRLAPTTRARARRCAETGAALELARRVPVSGAGRAPRACRTRSCPRSGDNSRDAARRSVEEIAALASPLGVRVALEVIPNALSTADALVDAARDELDCPRWASASTSATPTCMGDVVDAIETLSGLLIATHVHDNHGRRDEHLVPFDGTIDWTGALMALQKVGYDGTLMLRTAPARDPSASGARARRAGAIEQRLGRRGTELDMTHEGTARLHRRHRPARRPAGHHPGLAAQPAVERQDPLPDRPRRQRLHPGRDVEGGRRRGDVHGAPIT